MNQRTVIITLILVGLMTVIGFFEVQGWQGKKASDPPGCFDIEVHPIAMRSTYLVDRCTGNTWQIQEGVDGDLVWVPLKRYPYEFVDLLDQPDDG